MNFPTKIGTDEDGYIMKFSSKNNISSEYMILLNELIELLKQNIGDKLHSIYVYGSVGRGEAILGKSDVDLSIILSSPLTSIELNKLNRDKEKFLLENKSIPKVDFDIGILDDILKPQNLYYWGFWIKHICACIYGEDLSFKFPKMKPNKNICECLNQDIIDTLLGYKEQIIKDEFDNMTLISTLKRIIRGSYCLVSVVDKSWAVKTQDILPILNYYFPNELHFKEIGLMINGKKEFTYKKILELIDYFIVWFGENEVKQL